MCTVDTKEHYPSLEAFQEAVRPQKISFDSDRMILAFGKLAMSKKHRFYQGKQEAFPYPTYASPMLRSDWGSGRIQAGDVTLDFTEDV